MALGFSTLRREVRRPRTCRASQPEFDVGIDLPTPGVCFPCFPVGPNIATDDSTDAQLEALGEKVLITEGIIRKGDAGPKIQKRTNVPGFFKGKGDAGPRFKEGKRHLSYKDSCNQALPLRIGGDSTEGDPWAPTRALGPTSGNGLPST